MKPPLFIRPLSEGEQDQLNEALHTTDAFRLRRAQYLLASARGQKPKEIAKIFKRGDLVKTAEGLLAEVVTLFSNGKVGIQFLTSLKETTRTARIPERLSIVSRRKTMQFVQLPL